MIFEGVGKKGRRDWEGWGSSTAAAARKREQTGMERSAMPKGEAETQKHFRATAAFAKARALFDLLSDVVMVDGLLAVPYCFSLLETKFILLIV